MEIKDTGERRVFASGAVRDIQEGKGRCDLLCLDVASEFLNNTVLSKINQFKDTNNTVFLYEALTCFITRRGWDAYTMLLEVAKHFEAGAVKYGEYNWQKGIEVHSYIDSGVRHYLKWLRGDNDEPHDRAFVWNIMCCIWTCKHHAELNDFVRVEE